MAARENPGAPGRDPAGPPLPPPPRAAQLDRLSAVIDPLARLLQPRVYGAEAIPDRGVLFVGNHTLYGLIDVPFMIAELWRREIEVRALGDHAHYAIPVWRNLLEMCGMVRGTRENVRVLMSEGQNVLVFPGGSGEVWRARDERYRLKWKERVGFARLALEFGYPIVPFAAVGVEEMFDVLADEHTPVLGDASRLLERLVGVPIPPLGVGLGPLLPRPERLYFWFGEPIETACLAARRDQDAAAREVRDLARAAVEDGIAFLRSERAADPRSALRARLRSAAEEPPLADSDPRAWFVLRGLDAWNRGGPEGAAAWLSRWVLLVDPPGRPDAAQWRGREATIARLAQVTGELGGRWLHVTDAASHGEEVLVSLQLRSGRAHEGVPVGSFHLVCEAQQGEITRISAFESRAEALASLETA